LKVYSTTEKFKKYFGVQGDTDTLRQKLFKKVRARNSAKTITSSNNVSH
jgi:segregation and condensation protein B